MDPHLTGREAEIGHLDALLSSGERLICVTGPPGIGKSALVREVANRSWSSNRVVRVDLGGCRETNAAMVRIDAALGVRKARDRPAALAGPLVLWLDDADGVWSELARTATAWQRKQKRLRVVATSSQPARHPKEVLLDVAPLGADSAAELWAERRRRADPDYDIDASSTGRKIVQRLDGVPLALAFAADRTRILGDADMLRRLEEGAAITHASLDDMWALLSERERLLLTQCAVFRGEFTTQRIEAVMASSGMDDLCAVLEGLVEKSLVVARSAAGDSVVLKLLHHVRDYSRDRAGTVERDAAERRMMAFLMRRIRRVPVFGASNDDYRWCFEQRHDLLGVARAALRSGDEEEVRDAAAILCLEPLVAQGRTSTVLIEAALDTEACAGRTSLRALLLTALGERRVRVKARRAGLAALEEGYALAESLGEREICARAASRRLAAAARSGDCDDVADWYHRLSDLANLDSPATYAARGRLATAALVRGDIAQAQADALALVGAPAATLIPEAYNRALLVLGLADLETGRHDVALAPLGTAFEMARDLHLPDAAANLRWLMAKVEHARGDLDAALSDYGRAAELAVLARNRRVLACARAYLGLCLIEQGRRVEARRHIIDVLAHLAELSPVTHAFFEAVLLAEATLDLAGSDLPPIPETPSTSTFGWFAEAVPLLRRFWKLAEVRAASSRGDDRTVATVVAETQAAARAAMAQPTGLEVRALARWLRREADKLIARPTTATELVVEPGGSWFRIDDGQAVQCQRRRVIRRLLVALVRAHIEGPDNSLSSDALIAVGWPDETVAAPAARNRLRVALSRLRQLGLEGVLRVTPDGWRLCPDVHARFEETPPERQM